MATDDSPWEPPLAGTEVEHLIGALDRLRTTFRWKASGLDAAGLRRLVCGLIEECSRHPGHADLLREAVDGVVGEDRAARWHA